MGMRASQAQVKRRLRFLANKYCGVEFRVIYASNGETAILPVNPATGELECTDPAKFMPKELEVVYSPDPVNGGGKGNLGGTYYE